MGRPHPPAEKVTYGMEKRGRTWFYGGIGNEVMVLVVMHDDAISTTVNVLYGMVALLGVLY